MEMHGGHEKTMQDPVPLIDVHVAVRRVVFGEWWICPMRS